MKRGAIDIGNTRSKAGLFDEQGQLLMTEYFDTPQAAAEWLKEQQVSKAMVSDVKGAQTISADIIPLQFVGTHLKLPFTNLYRTPETLGTDRVAVMAAAATLYPGQASLVFDIGTCMTIDLLHTDNTYRGGNISPGLQMRLRAMHEFTGKLPLSGTEHNHFEWGDDTLSALANGAASGLLYEIEGYIAKTLQAYPDAQILMCGGDAHYFAKQLKYKIFANQNLVLLGLYHLLVFNDKNN